jgi:S1-C subfamily serine protease
MRNGFVILSVNEQPISTVEELQRTLAAAGQNAQVAGMYPGYNGMYYYGIGAGE